MGEAIYPRDMKKGDVLYQDKDGKWRLVTKETNWTDDVVVAGVYWPSYKQPEGIKIVQTRGIITPLPDDRYKPVFDCLSKQDTQKTSRKTSRLLIAIQVLLGLSLITEYTWFIFWLVYQFGG